MAVYEPMPLLSPLEHLPQLVHLTLRNTWSYPAYMADANTIEKLSHTFSRLASLKSLEVVYGPSLLEAVSRQCPQLEHLQWENTELSPQERSEWVKAFQAIGGSLAQLRSLVISNFPSPIPSLDWLEAIVERGRLEYLSLQTTLPASLLHKTIEKCPVSL